MKQKIVKSSLNNGSLLITEEIPWLSSSVFGVFVKIGSDYEPYALNGISHLVEHMLFKGTLKRDAKMIAEEIEALGGMINAYTSRDHTNYYFICLPEVMKKIISIFQDMVFNSIIPEDQLIREKQVILEELHSSIDDPQDLVFQNLNSMLFKNSIYEKTILGTEETIKAITRRDILKFMENYYCNSNLFLSYAGPQNHRAIMNSLNFSNSNKTPKSIKRNRRIKTAKGQLDYVYKSSISQFHVALGSKGVNYNSEEKFGLIMLSTILGSGMSSRLFRTLREDMGIVYEIYTFMESFLDSGVHGIYFICDQKNYRAAMNGVEEEINSICSGKITDEELEKAKTQIISGMKISYDSLSGRMRFLARSMLYYENITYINDIIKAVERISKEEVIKIAKKYMKFSDFNVSIVGNKRSFK